MTLGKGETGGGTWTLEGKMKIVEQSQERLVIEIRPIALAIMCIAFFLLFLVLGFGSSLLVPTLGGWLGFPAWMTSTKLPSGSSSHLVGYFSVVPLLLAIFLLKTRRLTFDRTTSQITAAARGIFGTTVKTYPLSAFAGAVLTSHRSKNSHTYRANLSFTDGTGPIKVTPYSTSGSGPSRMVSAINQWFGAAGGGASVTLSGEQAQQVLAALSQAGIVIKR